jgi:hypothetical protein
MEHSREEDSPSETILANASLPTTSFLLESDQVEEFMSRVDLHSSDTSSNASKSEFQLCKKLNQLFFVDIEKASSEPVSPKQDKKTHVRRPRTTMTKDNFRTSFRALQPSSLISDIIGKTEEESSNGSIVRSSMNFL